MPEVQFSEISEGNEANMINYDRGILLQSVAQEQIQQTGPVDVTVCHGGIITTPYFGPAMSGTNSREQVEEIEYTKCFNSGQFPQNGAQDVESGDLEQTRMFSDGAGIELDETCSRQEIFFRNYPNAPLSSPTNLEGKEEKRDATAFLASLKSSSSTFQENSEETFKMDSTSFLESLQQKPCSSSTGNVSLRRQPFSDLTDKKSCEHRAFHQGVKSDDDLVLTTCHSSHEVPENRMMHKRERRSIYEPADVDVTLCHGSGLSCQTDYQPQKLPVQTRIFSDGAGIELDETCSQQEIFFHNYPNAPLSSATNLEEKEEKRDATAFLASLKSSSSTCQENSEEIFKMDTKSFLASFQQKSCSSSTGNVDFRKPFSDVTDKKEKVNYDDDLELTACHSSHEVLDNHMHKREQSICDPADLDVELNVTACHGGIIEDTSNFCPEMPSIDSRQQAEEMEYTKCFSSSQFLQNAATNIESGDLDRTTIFSGDAGVELDVTCSQRDTFFQNYPKEEKRDATAFLASLTPSSARENSEDTFKMDSSSFLASLQKKPSFVQENEACTSAARNTSPKRQPFSEITGRRSVTSKQAPLTTSPSNLVERENKQDAKSFQVASLKSGSSKFAFLIEKPSVIRQPFSDSTGQKATTNKHKGVNSTCSGTQQESNFDSNLELTTCYNYEVQTNTQKTKRRSIYEPTDIDVTSCYGPGLVNSSDSTALNGKSTETTSQGLNDNTMLNSSARHLVDPRDTRVFGTQTSDARTNMNATGSIFATHDQAEETYKQMDKLDMTTCYGSGILPIKQSPLASTDHTVFFSANTGNTESLDFTICQGQDAFSRVPSSTLQTCQNELSNAGSYKMDTSAFKKASTAEDNNDEMDLTATLGSALGSKEFAFGSSWKLVDGTSEQTEAVGAKSLCSQIIEDDNVELTACHSYKVLDNNVKKSKRRSIYEPADIDITSCYSPGLTGMSGTQSASSNMNSTLKLEATKQETGVNRPNDSTVSNNAQDLSVTIQQKPEESELELSTCLTRIHKMKIKNYFLSSEVDPMSCFSSRSGKSSDNCATSNSPYDILNMPGCSEVATDRLNNDNTTLNKTQDLQSQRMPQQMEESTLELLTCHNQEDVEDDQFTSTYDKRKLSIIEETESEITKNEEQHVTQ